MLRALPCLAVLLAGCAMSTPPKQETGVAVDVPLFRVASDFNDGEPIPTKHGCDGAGVSLPLEWSGLPDGTTHLALLMDDPDAPRGTFTHWLWWDLPADRTGLPEGVDAAEAGAVNGSNSWGRTGYGGPCPPNGTHRYFLHLYALDGALGLPEGSSREAFAPAVQKHAIGHAVLMGRYTR